MGYDVTRFQGDVDEDLICPICSGVLEEPVQVSQSDGRFHGAVDGSGVHRKYSYVMGPMEKSLGSGSASLLTSPSLAKQRFGAEVAKEE